MNKCHFEVTHLTVHCSLKAKSKLLAEYNSQVHNFSMFRKIFVNEYSIGFSTPISDAFWKWIRLKYKIKKEVDITKHT